MPKIFTMVLAGGKGERLYPLTDQRAKPAVPFGGKYRIIDFTLSNCLNSGLRQIAVLIQYKSHSLDRHIRIGWNILNAELGEYITSVPPQQRISEDWYRGTPTLSSRICSCSIPINPNTCSSWPAITSIR